MISRRVFAGCGLCAALGLVATAVPAQQASPGFTRTVLGRTEVEGTGYDTIQVLLTINPDVTVARHTHPGTESGVVEDGEAVFSMQGEADRTIKPGDAVFIKQGVPHSVQNSGKPFRYLATYVVDRTKPLASPA